MFVVFYKYIFVKLVLKFIILFFIYFKYIDLYILGFLNRVMIKKKFWFYLVGVKFMYIDFGFYILFGLMWVLSFNMKFYGGIIFFVRNIIFLDIYVNI